jgi:DNA primase
VRSLDHLLASGLAVRVAVVPAPHDPDSLIKANGGEAFRKVIESAEGFFDYYLKRLCATNDVTADKGRLAVLRDMGEAVHKTGNGVLIDKYAQKTALRLGVSPDAVRDEFRKISLAKPTAPEVVEESIEGAAEMARPTTQEFWLLKLLLIHDDLAGWAGTHLNNDWVLHPLVKEIVRRRLAAQADESWQGLASFLNSCETPEMRNLVTEAVAEDRKLQNPELQLADVLKSLRNQFLDRQIAACIQRVSQPETPDAERMELLRRQQELRQQKQKPV